MMQSIDNYNFSGKRAIIRVDFNVPLDADFKVTDTTRIRAAIPTIKKVLSEGGSAILMSHLGRPKGVTEKFSLKHIIYKIEELLGEKIIFAEDCQDAAAQAAALKPGEVLLLENLRFYAEEDGKPRGLDADATAEDKAAAKKAVKESQKGFTKTLASYADCYINDAFGTAHRAHSSTALIAEYFANDKMFGYIMENELKAIDAVLLDAKKPFTAILGGSKVSTKITIIESLMERVDNLVLGGGMTFTFVAALGGKIGNSLCEKDQFEMALDILAKAKAKGVNIYLPFDTLSGESFSNDCATLNTPSDEIPDGWLGLDIGPKAIEDFSKVIENSATILWNGPVGVFEMDTFAAGSRAIAESMVKATEKGAFSLVGGGDSVACINKLGLATKVSYVSTGGGALLEYMEGKVLPGVAAIKA